MTDKIIIPQKIYVGVRDRSSNSFPLAAVTAWGNDSAAKGRMETVDRHSKDAVTIDNQPQLGFSIHSYSWKDETMLRDPRGFSFYLKNHLMISLLKQCTVVNGSIVEPCVYARSRGDLVLLNTRSEQYHQAVLMTEIANSKASWRNAQLGNRVTLTNGIQGIYLGCYFFVSTQSGHWINPQTVDSNRVQLDANKRHVIVQDRNVRHYLSEITKRMYVMASPRLARIDSTETITASQAEQMVNELLHDDRTYCDHGYANRKAAVSKNIDFDSLTISMTDIHSHTDLDTALNNGMVVVELEQGKLGVLHNIMRNNNVIVTEIDTAHLAANRLVFSYRKDLQGLSNITHNLPVSSLTNLKHLQFSLKTSLGNSIIWH